MTAPTDPRRAGLAGVLVIGVEAATGNQIWTALASGGAPARLSPEGAFFPTDARSPDGAVVAIAVDGGDVDHREQLALVTVGAVRRLGPPAAVVRSPSAVADGWVVEASLDSFRDLYRIGADGGSVRMTDTPEGNFQPQASPDGRELAFSSSRDGDAEIYVQPTSGAPRRLTAFRRDDWGPRWSPNGDALAFVSDRTGAPAVYVVGRDGTGLVRVGAGEADGAAVAVGRTPGMTEGAAVAVGRTPGMTAGDGVAVGRTPGMIATEGEADGPVWSPDGARLAWVVRAGGGYEVWIATREGGGARRVSAPGEIAQQPVWSPDGRYVAYVRGADRAELVAVALTGGAPISLVRSNTPLWSPGWRSAPVPR